jgi:hypothetical protein
LQQYPGSRFSLYGDVKAMREVPYAFISWTSPLRFLTMELGS